MALGNPAQLQDLSLPRQMGAAMHQVCVIVTVFNGQTYLRGALESVVQQVYRPLQLVVVDDGSTDESAAIARSFPEAVVISQENQGVAGARNTGIRASDAEVLAFLDADDFWEPTKLSLQMAFMDAHPEVEVAYGRFRQFLSPGQECPEWVDASSLEQLDAGYSPLPSTLAVRRSAFERVGLFDPAFRNCDDLEWYFRVRSAGVRMALVEEAVTHRRVHPDNLSHQSQRDRQPIILQLARARVRWQRNPRPAPEVVLPPRGIHA